MTTGTSQSTVPPHKFAPPAKIPLPQGELDEFPHLRREDWFGG